MNVFVNPSIVQRITGVQINEIEILIGSLMDPVFYIVGDKMASGKIYEEGSSQVVKSFQVKFEDIMENLRVKNSFQLQKIKEIYKVFHFIRNGNEVVGFDIGEEKPIYVSANIVKGLTSLDLNEMYILKGSFIAPEYYDIGENIYEGINRKPEMCRKSGMILKNLNLRLLDEIDVIRKKNEIIVPQTKNKYFRTQNDFEDVEPISNEDAFDSPEQYNDFLASI